ncbi:MAG: hypothetical protein ACREQ5_31575, partial [Candidatus Dormibacteria bacterium]
MSIATTNGSAPVCTLGFVVQRNRQYFATTAGHCSNTGTTWYQAGTTVANGVPNTYMGTVAQNDLTNPPAQGACPCTTNADAEIIGIGINQVSNSTMITAAQIQYVTAVQGQDQDQIGDMTCVSGRYSVSNWLCGPLGSKTQSYVVAGGNILLYQRWVNGPHPIYGDSGSPVFKSDGTAVGSHTNSCDNSSDPNSCHGWLYSHIYDVTNQLGVSAVTGPTWPGPYYQAPVRAASATDGSATDGSLFIDAVDGTVRRMDLANKSWETLPAVPVGAVGNPSAVQAVGSSRLDVFIRGGDGYLYHNSDSTGAFYAWSSTWDRMPYAPVGISSDPTAINEGVYGVVEVFARAADGYLYQWRESNFSGWGVHEYS